MLGAAGTHPVCSRRAVPARQDVSVSCTKRTVDLNFKCKCIHRCIAWFGGELHDLGSWIAEPPVTHKCGIFGAVFAASSLTIS